MNQSIINQYEIRFKNLVEQFPGSAKEIDKRVHTNNRSLSVFLYELSASDIDNYLLPDINAALLDPNSENDTTGSETIFIIIYQDMVELYDFDDTYIIPTLDLKEILIGWRDFLRTPPLNGTRV